MSALLSFIGWSFLPTLTSTLLRFWYCLITRAGDPQPEPGTPVYVKAYKRVNFLVITLYLLYTIYESYNTIVLEPNFYKLLGAGMSASDRELKGKFRRLTVMYHPDKVGPQGEAYFVMLKTAYDTLVDPVKRAAYERFGPDILEWRHCSSAYDYLVRGVTMVVPYYLGSVVVLVILGVLGKMEFGRYWRFYAFFCMIVLESFVVTRPFHLFTQIPILNMLLPFEQLALARKILFTTFIAISQLAPLFHYTRLITGPLTAEALGPQLDRLANLLYRSETEASTILTQELIPFDADPKVQKKLGKKLEEWMIESAIRSTPEVRDAVGKVIQRRRTGAPSGAKGMK
ncbi:hypothetical protein L873DRAFT_1368955 [Choiromyces venosus 120613-1]|uniref:J domain-containing protein n=1 Tax=Choiromyces venosus 120613-1 TaxID=1336337 RepID=A0A3N4K1R9_9PEZI|nr:hypothetical protein L873DRAFT_1368955 [Choiromyces venosus 120613-1]